MVGLVPVLTGHLPLAPLTPDRILGALFRHWLLIPRDGQRAGLQTRAARILRESE